MSILPENKRPKWDQTIVAIQSIKYWWFDAYLQEIWLNVFFVSKRVFLNIEHRSYRSSILIESYFRLHKHRVKIHVGTCTLYNVISGAVLMSPSSNTSTAFNIVAKIYFECFYVMSFCLFKQIISSLYFRAWNKCIYKTIWSFTCIFDFAYFANGIFGKLYAE